MLFLGLSAGVYCPDSVSWLPEYLRLLDAFGQLLVAVQARPAISLLNDSGAAPVGRLYETFHFFRRGLIIGQDGDEPPELLVMLLSKADIILGASTSVVRVYTVRVSGS